MFCACASGDINGVQRLLQSDPALVRSQYAYRTPLYFAVRENQLAVVQLLLNRGADPLSLAVNDSLLDICHHRGYADLQQLLLRHYSIKLSASRHGEAVAAAIRAHNLAEVR
jgi:ankyrin repeat protein